MISQWHMSSRASILFRGHVLLYMGMELRNPKHERDADDAVQEQCENVSARLRAQLPPRLRHCILNPWNAYAVSFSDTSFTARQFVELSGEVSSLISPLSKPCLARPASCTCTPA